ncbi:prosaposin-like [Hydractinia symbiolongicarpus]|uniref:prosaposin-like n=1 Tax=Hydractinia symbiolongicarpus TaxID=13093 RepID=UPI00254E0314|nr:prosaposin-like [Hydractinia symbiolongicarpus]
MILVISMLILSFLAGIHWSQFHTEDFVKFEPKLVDGVCDKCKLFINAIHQLISSNSTRTEVLSALKDGCQLLPPSLKSQCVEVVTTYGEQLLNILDEFLADPDVVCSTIGFCNSTRTAGMDKKYLKKVLEEVFRNSQPHLPAQLKGISNCALCEMILVIIQGIFEDTSTQMFVKEEIGKLCALLPTPADVSECHKAVDLLEPKVYEYIVRTYFAPMKFCPGIGLC